MERNLCLELSQCLTFFDHVLSRLFGALTSCLKERRTYLLPYGRLRTWVRQCFVALLVGEIQPSYALLVFHPLFPPYTPPNNRATRGVLSASTLRSNTWVCPKQDALDRIYALGIIA